MSSFNYPSLGGSGVNSYANFTALPLGQPDGTVAVTLDTNTIYVYDLGTTTWVNNGSSVMSIGTIDTGTAANDGAQVISNALVQGVTVSATTVSASGNITGGNIISDGLISVIVQVKGDDDSIKEK
jgi:hypothetical protein